MFNLWLSFRVLFDCTLKEFLFSHTLVAFWLTCPLHCFCCGVCILMKCLSHKLLIQEMNSNVGYQSLINSSIRGCEVSTPAFIISYRKFLFEVLFFIHHVLVLWLVAIFKVVLHCYEYSYFSDASTRVSRHSLHVSVCVFSGSLARGNKNCLKLFLIEL